MTHDLNSYGCVSRGCEGFSSGLGCAGAIMANCADFS